LIEIIKLTVIHASSVVGSTEGDLASCLVRVRVGHATILNLFFQSVFSLGALARLEDEVLEDIPEG
jgi:hypothetical protein